MQITVLRSKIHRVTVTQADLNYIGSITIDETLMDAAGLFEYEKVQVVDLNNGCRLETYVIKGGRDSGVICLNGAAARLIHPNDLVIIMSYAMMDENEIKDHRPKIVFVDENNRLIDITDAESAMTDFDRNM
jgi:aspartate 1-decarboxylase